MADSDSNSWQHAVDVATDLAYNIREIADQDPTPENQRASERADSALEAFFIAADFETEVKSLPPETSIDEFVQKLWYVRSMAEGTLSSPHMPEEIFRERDRLLQSAVKTMIAEAIILKLPSALELDAGAWENPRERMPEGPIEDIPM